MGAAETHPLKTTLNLLLGEAQNVQVGSLDVQVANVSVQLFFFTSILFSPASQTVQGANVPQLMGSTWL